MYVSNEMGQPLPPLSSYALLPMLFWRLLLSVSRQKHSPHTADRFSHEYDYIVVGAGSAGSVVAARLSELPCVSVLLLEAGKAPPVLTEVPGFGRAFWFTSIDWKYRTAPQKHTGAGLVNRQLVWPSGKALGGSSVLNAMLGVRGNRINYDRWEEEGAKGWSYRDVLPYFKKMEDNRDPEYVANGFHGVYGPQTVHRPRYESEFKRALFKTAESLGYQILDSNGPRQTGFFDYQSTMRGGQRCSTAKAYLVPAESRKNLDIVPGAFVRKVVIKNRRAVGVQFDHGGRTFEVWARKEVLMAAGAINTAQLLMLSGIGPRRELERFNIPVIADLPVGLNLQDHIGSAVNFLLPPHVPTVIKKMMNPLNIEQFIQNRTGPLTSCEFATAIAFLKNGIVAPKVDFPDHQLYFAEAVSGIFLQAGVTPRVYKQAILPYIGKSILTCISQLLNPKSRGTVTLQSKDPYVMPVIDPNYLHDPRDVYDMVQGLKTCKRIGGSPIMRAAGVVPTETLIPGCESYAGREDEYLTCVTKSVVATFSHQVGTARMGHPRDPRTVVDPHLRVLHVKGLRVVDASVMPIVPSANTNLPTMMVAEKASDLIKSTIKCHGLHVDWWNETTEYDLERATYNHHVNPPRGDQFHAMEHAYWNENLNDILQSKREDIGLNPEEQLSDENLHPRPYYGPSSLPVDLNIHNYNFKPAFQQFSDLSPLDQAIGRSFISNELFANNRSLPHVDINLYPHAVDVQTRNVDRPTQYRAKYSGSKIGGPETIGRRIKQYREGLK